MRHPADPSLVSRLPVPGGAHVIAHEHDNTDTLLDRFVASYLCDVLCLEGEDTEEALEERLRAEAQLLGLGAEPPAPDSAVEQQKQAVPDDAAFSSHAPRHSQESSLSRGSQSTGFTSTYSDVSRERPRPRRHAYPPSSLSSRFSLTIRSGDHVPLTRGRPIGRLSPSPSPPITPSHSNFSLSLKSLQASQKQHFRRIRGLSKLRLSRNNSRSSILDACSLCNKTSSTPCQPVHRLPCGHCFCDEAIRSIMERSDRTGDVVVRCHCGQIIPGQVLDAAIHQEQLDWERASSTTASIISQRRDSIVTQAQSLVTRRQSDSTDLRREPMVQPPQRDLDDVVVQRNDFKDMRRRQEEQRDRMLAWLETQRSQLECQRQAAVDDSRQSYEHIVTELTTRHDAAMAEAEDKQVKAEAKMRSTHEKAKRDNATALKHMEAYCAGVYSSGEPHKRVITPQDRLELDKKRQIRDSMDARHTSAINVLRGEQNGRIRERARRRDAELHELFLAQQRELEARTHAHARRMAELDEFARGRRARIRRRWRLETAVYIKKIENESNVRVQGRVPEVDWPPIAAPAAPHDSTIRRDPVYGA